MNKYEDLLLLCLWIKTIESFHSINPIDLSCKKHEYQLIINQSKYVISSDNSTLTLQVVLGFDNEHKASLLTDLWSEENEEQFLSLHSTSMTYQINGQLDRTQNNSWNFHSINKNFSPNAIVNIESTLFHKQIDLILQTNKNYSCSTSNSLIDFAICCHLCSTNSPTCSNIRILSEHSRSDLLVTNSGLILFLSLENVDKDFHCLPFPSMLDRFSSTITNGMNMNQIPDVLKIYKYKRNENLELENGFHHSEIFIETNVSSSTYFHMYFHMLSNMFYLIGKENIYVSNNYGEKFIRIWKNDLAIINLIILDPIVFTDSGHLAFMYQTNESTSSFRYFAVLSKAGLYYTWRTQLLQSSISIDPPFFFDSTGSFYFNTIPPLLIILATEQSLVATENLVENSLFGPFFIHETDLSHLFTFCSLTKWDNRFELIGSTIQFDKLGSFFIIDFLPLYSSFPFCLQTTRLTSESLQTSRNCSLILHPLSTKNEILLELSDCYFTNNDQYSTIIISQLLNIFIEKILNETFAKGRSFQERNIQKTSVNHWNMFSYSKVEQIFDRCLLTNIDLNSHRLSFLSLPPTITYPLINGDALVTKKFYLLTENDYALNGNNLYITTSFFNNKKSIIQQEFLHNQFSCYLPLIRTRIFRTQCLKDMIIEFEFEIHSDLAKLSSIQPPKNFQLNRYKAGFRSVIVYNVDDEKSIACDGYKNCSCLLSSFSHQLFHCAKQFYTLDSTVNNLVYMKIYLTNDKTYLANNQSIFLIEELANRSDYEILNNLWSNEIKKQILNVFEKNSDPLKEDEKKILHIISNEKNLFVGPNLRLKFLDEGLFHFRLTYLWGDQFCLTSVDLPILLKSNTPIITSYLFKYFLACIFILILILILWFIYTFFHEKFLSKKITNSFFTQRIIEENQNFEMLVQIREQSNQLLPYQEMIAKENQQILLQKHIKQLVNQITNLS